MPLQENSASNGGAVFLKSGIVNLRGCDFTENIALNGGAVYFEDVIAFENSILWNRFLNNEAQNGGGAIYILDSEEHKISKNLFLYNTADEGGGLYVENSEIVFFNNTLFQNTSLATGGGLYSSTGNNRLYNNIFWNNFSSDNSQIAGSGLDVTFNNVEGGYPGDGNFSGDHNSSVH